MSVFRGQKEKIQQFLKVFFFFFLSDRRGSNPRPAAWEAAALPTELLSRKAPLKRSGRHFIALKEKIFSRILEALDSLETLEFLEKSSSSNTQSCCRPGIRAGCWWGGCTWSGWVRSSPAYSAVALLRHTLRRSGAPS